MQNVIIFDERVEKWGKFEIRIKGPVTQNPFVDVQLKARFASMNSTCEVDGFYDGKGIYSLRFMPSSTGEWTFSTISNYDELCGIEGKFDCIEPTGSNHGPVKVEQQYHFIYSDGTPYYPFGTTSYGWVHQKKELADCTLNALKNSPFNKIRMCLLPHYSEYSSKNIEKFPFEGEPENDWDYMRFQPEYFQMVESRIESLLSMGIEADIILFHPYSGPWGFGRMTHSVDVHYLKYVVSRLASYRNVWWSMANEYDFIPEKSEQNWDDLCKVVYESDPYRHLLSIHNGTVLYGHWKPWIDHACIQDGLAVSEPGRAVVLRNAYHKPVIYDEVCYEGNFDVRWGDLSAEELVYRFWQGIVSGTYVGHGEVIKPEGMSGDHVWTGIGGELRGSSLKRIEFLRQIVENTPGYGFEPVDKWWHSNIASKIGKYFLVYLGKNCCRKWTFKIPCKELGLQDGEKYRVEIIDTWNMEIYPYQETYEIMKKDAYFYWDKNDGYVNLPDRPYMALRLIPVGGCEKSGSISFATPCV